jgi:hypothetical protein
MLLMTLPTLGRITDAASVKKIEINSDQRLVKAARAMRSSVEIALGTR